MVYIKGKDNILADFISRNIKETPIDNMTNIGAIEFHSLLVDNTELINKQRADKMLQKLYYYFCSKHSDLKSCKLYAKHLSKLSLNLDGIIVYIHKGEEKVVAPSSVRKDIINMCHNSYLSGHQGTYKTHQHILCRFWWPNLFRDVVEAVRQCDLCQRIKVEHKKPGKM